MTVAEAKVTLEGVIIKTQKSDAIVKEMKTGQNLLDRIEIEKVELMTFNYFIENAPEA